MSVTDVRAYFRTRMNSLGFKEHKDALNFDNIPSTNINKAYHIESGTFSVISQNHARLDGNSAIKLRVFYKGFRDTSAGIDTAIAGSETIVCDVVKPENANGTSIKTVILESSDTVELGESNDNIIVLEMNFNVRIITDIR